MSDEQAATVQVLKTLAPLDGMKRENLSALAKKVSVKTLTAGRVHQQSTQRVYDLHPPTAVPDRHPLPLTALCARCSCEVAGRLAQPLLADGVP